MYWDGPAIRVKRVFHKKNGKQHIILDDVKGDIEDLRKKDHARWHNDMYEFVHYDVAKIQGVDYECHYYQIDFDKTQHISYDRIEHIYASLPLPKCECGAEATGSPRHSHWCDKWEPW